MESSSLIEVYNTSILRTGALHCYHYTLNRLPAPRLLLPRSGLERSDFVLWHIPDVLGDGRPKGLANFARPSYSGPLSKCTINLSWKDNMVRLVALAVAACCCFP